MLFVEPDQTIDAMMFPQKMAFVALFSFALFYLTRQLLNLENETYRDA